MIKSRHFWIGIILIAIIPLLLVDIVEHYLSWQKEVKEQLIYAIQNASNFSTNEKAGILSKAFKKNKALIFLITIKSLISLILLFTGFYQLNIYLKRNKPALLKPVLLGIAVVFIFSLIKYFWVVGLNTNPDAQFINAGDTSFQSIISKNFKGKVVYVDFWGTNCGPCLVEFENYTHPLQNKYKSNPNIAWLYIAAGNKYLWKKQIDKYKIAGSHLFLDQKAYKAMYHDAIKNDSEAVATPRYVIVDKQGNTVVNDARSPANKDSLYMQIDKYLN